MAVTFDAANPNPEPSFYKYYGQKNSENWVEAIAYHPTGISHNFINKNQDAEIERCLKIVANIGNSHVTGKIIMIRSDL